MSEVPLYAPNGSGKQNQRRIGPGLRYVGQAALDEVPLYSSSSEALQHSGSRKAKTQLGDVEHCCRKWSSNSSGKCSYERPTRGTVCGTMRSMCGADAGCLAINYQSLLSIVGETRVYPCFAWRTRRNPAQPHNLGKTTLPMKIDCGSNNLQVKTLTLPFTADQQKGGKACLLIRKHDHYTPARKMKRDVRALTARNNPEERFYPMERLALQDQLKGDLLGDREGCFGALY